jgi:prephenate dehydrogenase (NADP+)
VTEYVFRKPQLLDEVIKTAIEDNTFRSDDLEFTFAARVSSITDSFIALVSFHCPQGPCRWVRLKLIFEKGWSDCVSFGNFSSYQDRFERIQTYFAPRFPEATRVGNEMIRTILEKM